MRISALWTSEALVEKMIITKEKIVASTVILAVDPG